MRKAHYLLLILLIILALGIKSGSLAHAKHMYWQPLRKSKVKEQSCYKDLVFASTMREWLAGIANHRLNYRQIQNLPALSLFFPQPQEL